MHLLLLSNCVPSLKGTDGCPKVTFEIQVATCWNNDLLFAERKFSGTQILIQVWNNTSRAKYAVNHYTKHASK